MDYGELTTGAFLMVTPDDLFQVINHNPDDFILTACAITAGVDKIVIEDRRLLITWFDCSSGESDAFKAGKFRFASSVKG
jgi:hypothetical protein